MALAIKRKLSVVLGIFNGVTSSLTLTNCPAAATILNGTSTHVRTMDLSSFSEVRLTAKVSTVGFAGTKLKAKFSTLKAFSTVVTDYTHMGLNATEVGCLIDSLGLMDSGWVVLNKDARADVSIAVISEGGNAVADPVLDNITLQFRTKERYI